MARSRPGRGLAINIFAVLRKEEVVVNEKVVES
jgi:hypothetical protein